MGKNFQVAALCNQARKWNAGGIISFDGKNGAVGFKVSPGKADINFELGVGYAVKDFRGYVKFDSKKKATFLFHPTRTIAGVSAVAKADVTNMASNSANAGATFSAGLCKGWDWKVGVRYN